MVDQVTVFIENDRGRLAALCRSMGDAGISMRTLTLADTADYGVVRIICDAPHTTRALLDDAGYRVAVTKVLAVKIPNRPGGLADLFEALDSEDINIEYAYCFSIGDQYAIDIVRTEQIESAQVVAREAGFDVLEPQDLYVPDAES